VPCEFVKASVLGCKAQSRQRIDLAVQPQPANNDNFPLNSRVTEKNTDALLYAKEIQRQRLKQLRKTAATSCH
jgi:hypothetical protein